VATDEDAHVVRELIEQGYAVIAPDYEEQRVWRGYWKKLIMGDWKSRMPCRARVDAEHHRRIDAKRVGMVGWSHGGLIALMTVSCILKITRSVTPESRKRSGGKDQNPRKDYEQLFSAPYHLGKNGGRSPEEYRRRSPV